MKPRLFLLILIGSFFVSNLPAQIVLKTNVVIPIANVIDSKNYGGGFDISLDIRLFPKNVLRISAYQHKQIMQNSMPDFNAMASSSKLDYFNKDGLRIALKNYMKKGEEASIPFGFYWGVFIDIMYAQRTIINRTWEKSVGYSENKLFEAKGLFWGAGINAGYTFKLKRFIIEPNVGLGRCFFPKKFITDEKDSFVPDLDRFFINLTVCHVELHIGWEL